MHLHTAMFSLSETTLISTFWQRQRKRVLQIGKAMLAPAFSIYPPKSTISSSYTPLPKQRSLSPPCSLPLRPSSNSRIQTRKPSLCCALRNEIIIAAFLGAGLGLTVVGPSLAAELPLLGSSVLLNEPSNALSLPTWAVHVSSVVEWVTAMALAWQYGEKPGYETWKGLSWGMVPLLGGAFCACTWHFFYNSESLEVLVALQAALTVIGNATMCIAAFRIYKSQDHSETS